MLGFVEEVDVDFEVFDKRRSSLGKQPTATLQKRGILSLNAPAHALIGDAESVEMLFSPSDRVIALRASEAPHAYKLRVVNENTGAVVLSMRAFTEHYGINTDESQKLTPYEQDGMLCMKLDDEAKGDSSS